MLASLQKRPKARARVGVALGPDRLVIATVRRPAQGRPVLEHCEVHPRPDGPSAWLLERLQALDVARVPTSVVLQQGEYQLTLIEAPDVLPAELRAAVRWRLRDIIDFHIDDAVVDVFDIPAQSRRNQGRMMYAVAARRSAIEQYVAAFGPMKGFDVIDVPELCMRNLAGLLPAAANGVALLHLGGLIATVVLVREQTLYLARQMDLQATMHSAARTMRLDPSTIALELQRSLDYYERNYDQPPIGDVAIVPADERSAAIAADLAAETGLRVSALVLGEYLDCAAPLAPDVEAVAALAVGAALREEKRTL